MRTANLFASLPRNPILRALALIAGAALLIGSLAVGLLIGAAVIAATALAMLVRRWLHGHHHRRDSPGVIEGEFTVMPRATLPPTEQASTTRSGW